MKSDIVTLKYGNTRTFLLRGTSGNLLIDDYEQEPKVYPLRTRSCMNDRIIVSRTQSENQKGC